MKCHLFVLIGIILTSQMSIAEQRERTRKEEQKRPDPRPVEAAFVIDTVGKWIVVGDGRELIPGQSLFQDAVVRLVAHNSVAKKEDYIVISDLNFQRIKDIKTGNYADRFSCAGPQTCQQFAVPKAPHDPRFNSFAVIVKNAMDEWFRHQEKFTQTVSRGFDCNGLMSDGIAWMESDRLNT